MRLPTIAILLLLANMGCAENRPTPAAPASRIGSQCTVHIRPEVLGMASDLPLSVKSSGLNGATTAIDARLTQIGAEWIVVETQREVLHIPQACILMLAFSKPDSSSPHSVKSEPHPPEDAHSHGVHEQH